MLKLTEEESIFAEQLYDIRRKIRQLKVEETTQADKLMAILRGHGVHIGTTGSYTVVHTADDNENIVNIFKDEQP